jgi:hypothetical protein
MIAAFGALALVVLSGLTRTLLMGASAPFFVELRRALLLVLRPFLIVGTYFFLVPWRRLASNEWKKFFLIPGLRWLPWCWSWGRSCRASLIRQNMARCLLPRLVRENDRVWVEGYASGSPATVFESVDTNTAANTNAATLRTGNLSCSTQWLWAAALRHSPLAPI